MEILCILDLLLLLLQRLALVPVQVHKHYKHKWCFGWFYFGSLLLPWKRCTRIKQSLFWTSCTVSQVSHAVRSMRSEVWRQQWPHGGSVAPVPLTQEAQIHTLKHTQTRNRSIQSFVLLCRRLHLINIKETQGTMNKDVKKRMCLLHWGWNGNIRG